MEVTVNIEWEEEAGAEKIYRPSSMTVLLFRNHERFEDPVNDIGPNLYEDNGWSYTWKNLPDDDYIVEEVPEKGDFFKPAVIEKTVIEKTNENIDRKTITLRKSMRTGVVELSMKVAGAAAETNRHWNFSIDGLGNHVCRYSKHRPGFDDEDGMLIDGESFTLKHGESITLSDIPITQVCTLNWEDNKHGYGTTCIASGTSGIRTFKEDKQSYLSINFINSYFTTLSVEVTKYRDTIPDAEPERKSKKKLILLCLTCLGLLLAVASKCHCFQKKQ